MQMCFITFQKSGLNKSFCYQSFQKMVPGCVCVWVCVLMVVNKETKPAVLRLGIKSTSPHTPTS